MSQDIVNGASAVRPDEDVSAVPGTGVTEASAAEASSQQVSAAEDSSQQVSASEVSSQQVSAAGASSEPQARQDAEALSEAKERKEKKPVKAGKVILIISAVLLLLILLLAGAALFTVRAMFKDDMAHAPAAAGASASDIDALITSSAKTILIDKTIPVEQPAVNAALDMIKETVNGSADSFSVEDLFCEIGDDEAVVYTRVHVDSVPVNGRAVKLDKVLPASVCFDAAYEDPYMVLTPLQLRCGAVDMPDRVLQKLLESASSSVLSDGNGVSVKDGKIYVDISSFSIYAELLAEKEINELMKDEEVFEEYRTAAGDDSMFNYIEDSTEVRINGLDIEGGRLVFYADVSMLINQVHDRPDENVIAGDYFFFGSDPQSTDSPEPVKWLVLDVHDGKALAISEMLLDCRLYNDEYKDTVWSDCSLRKWLNGDFYNTAFSDGEKSVIQTVRNTNPDNKITCAAGGPDTEDKVFCLALDEAKDWGKNIELSAAVTEYAKSRGAYVSDNYDLDGKEAGYWWLRSPGLNNTAAACVYPNGVCSNSGQYFVSPYDICVRPVIEVSLTEE